MRHVNLRFRNVLVMSAVIVMPWFGGVKAETLRPDKRIVKLRVVKDRDKQQTETTPVRFGKIPAGHYPIAETVVVDYRDDEPSRMRLRGELTGPMPISMGGGGTNGGNVATGSCTYDIECDDGHPCTLDVCNIVIGAPVGTGKCVNTAYANGDVGECDDGIFCNGIESCQGSDGVTPGTCTAGAVPCTISESCNEDYQCHPICTLDTECDDGLGCNGSETCVDGACIAGENPCGPNADCLDRVCQGCGPGCNNQRPCNDDSDCVGNSGEPGTCTGPLTCFYGRCCTTTDGGVTYDCAAAKFSGAQACTGLWYADDNGRFSNACGPTAGGCPKYSAGIAPHGDFLSVVGPVSDSVQPVPNAHGQGVGPATPLNKLGDDYQLLNHPSFMNLQYVRLVAGMSEPGFAVIEIYDEHGHFIEDFMFEIQDSSIAVRVVEFEPPVVVPSRGFIVLRNASNYSPNAHLYWLSTDETDVGVNDPDVLWVNGGLQGGPDASMSNFLTGPGILAFELVGLGDPYNDGNDKVPAPLGACCNDLDGRCNDLLSWDCRGTGDHFVGVGTTCATCSDDSPLFGSACRTCSVGSTNAGDPCIADAGCDGGTCDLNDSICRVCDGGDNPGAPCPNGDECTGGGSCLGRCEPIATCNTGACCDVATGDCIDDSTVEACDGEFQGYGTDCRSSCCTQPVDKWRDPNGDANNDGVPDGPWSGGDSCDDAYVHQFTIIPGNPPVGITITGDNSPASSTLENPDSCPIFFNNEVSDRGWWEAFHIDRCAFVWIDKCCPECEGDCKNITPFLVQGCPCQKQIGPTDLPQVYCPNCYSLGIHSYAINKWICDDVSDLQFFGPLPAGTYYYPVPSGVGDHIGPYQMHITVDPCPVTNCCTTNEAGTASECTQLDIFACENGGGFFHGPPNRPDAVVGCQQGFCDEGACCTGPGACLDKDGLAVPFSISTCLAEGGRYFGGLSCYGGYCSNDPLQSCNDDVDCGGGGATCLGDEAHLAQPNPCPVCEIQGQNNCQMFDPNSFTYNFLPSDLGMTGQPVLADDFIPLSDTLSSACVWGFYLRYEFYQEIFDPDCDDDVGGLDRFRVRVYANSTNDLPGAMIGESLFTSTVKVRLEIDTPLTDFSDYGPIDTYAFNVVLDPPITGLVLDGRRYWIEVVNDLYWFGDCNWWWWQLDHSSEQGNRYGATGFGGEYQTSSANIYDQTMCLSTDFFQPLAPVHPCCRCLDGTCTMETLFDCRNLDGEWMIEDVDCESITCETGPPVNDSCMNPIEITEVPFQQQFNNFCASTDGFNPVNWWPGDSIGNDVWFTYTPPEDCWLTVSMCATGTSFDSYIALYSFDTSECPCALSGDIVTHADSFIEASDEGCTGEYIGGSGYLTVQAFADTCYTIRAGGWGKNHGTGILDVECERPISKILPDPVGSGSFACRWGPNDYGLPCWTCNGGPRDGQLCLEDQDCGGALCIANDALCEYGYCGGAAFPWPKSRYIGFTSGWNWSDTAIRVKLIDVKNHPECTDQVRWVGPPMQHCESGACTTTFMASSLQDTPYFTNWTAYGVVQVMGQEIVPQSRFAIQAIDISSSGRIDNEFYYSRPALHVDTGKWGDVVAPFDGFTSSSQPQISDVLAIVDKWLGSLEPRKARAQQQPQVPNPGADVGIADILKAVDAWLGSPFPYPIDTCGP